MTRKLSLGLIMLWIISCSGNKEQELQESYNSYKAFVDSVFVMEHCEPYYKDVTSKEEEPLDIVSIDTVVFLQVDTCISIQKEEYRGLIIGVYDSLYTRLSAYESLMESSMKSEFGILRRRFDSLVIKTRADSAEAAAVIDSFYKAQGLTKPVK